MWGCVRLLRGAVLVSGEATHAQHSLDEVIRFMEGHTEAELTGIEHYE